MITFEKEKGAPIQQELILLYLLYVTYDNQPEEEEIQIIIQYWVRILNIRLGWINDFDKLVAKYASKFFIFETFRSSSKLLKTFTGHASTVRSLDYSTFNSGQYICSGSEDKTVRVWNVESNKQILSFNGHSDYVFCVKFSQYHHHNHRRNVICSSSWDNTIRFWDIKDNQQFQIFNEHTDSVNGIEFSPFNGGRYLCSGSDDKTICLWDVETYKSLRTFNGHNSWIWCVDISPLQSNNNHGDKSNSIGVIGGNGYTICSGSEDKTIRLWDIETANQLIVIKGHEDTVKSVKYGSNELGISGGANTILSGSEDYSVRLWDTRSGQQIQVFSEHKDTVYAVEYSPFIVNNNEIGINSNVICSVSADNTIRFWDIRSNKDDLHVIHGNEKEDFGIFCLKFLQLKKNRKSNCNWSYDINLCYGSQKGHIHILGYKMNKKTRTSKQSFSNFEGFAHFTFLISMPTTQNKSFVTLCLSYTQKGIQICEYPSDVELDE
ncbi:WD-40 repeat protein [Reticulomyxa filosa]|uniref:WD-40 repeat protein n=1 Tax=Reticulomyxa filosa TaxID=46433 RepID=X6PA85_RETFI|nr:WD-40 repeat protein [Reticulomyxa filosa]|eukprot:ETO35435.1 WD-40 repeat protein [Reticulomyxa filosa]